MDLPWLGPLALGPAVSGPPWALLRPDSLSGPKEAEEARFLIVSIDTFREKGTNKQSGINAYEEWKGGRRCYDYRCVTAAAAWP